jgi:hypothetical protein
MDPSQWVKSLNDYVLATVCVALAISVVFLFKELMKAKSETLTMATQILPVAQRLGDGVIALERMTDRTNRGDNHG